MNDFLIKIMQLGASEDQSVSKIEKEAIEKEAIEEYEKHFQVFEDVKLLLEGYERRLKTIGSELKNGGNDLTINRLGTKSSCYRTIISELSRIVKKGNNTIKNKE